MRCPKCGRMVEFSKVDAVGEICPCVVEGVETMKNEPKPDVDPALANVLQDAQPKVSFIERLVEVQTNPKVGICGQCPRCGAPIFGPQVVNLSETQAGPTIRYTCDCRKQKTFEETIRTT